jgi:hypothetical protein
MDNSDGKTNVGWMMMKKKTRKMINIDDENRKMGCKQADDRSD